MKIWTACKKYFNIITQYAPVYTNHTWLVAKYLLFSGVIAFGLLGLMTLSKITGQEVNSLLLANIITMSTTFITVFIAVWLIVIMMTWLIQLVIYAGKHLFKR